MNLLFRLASALTWAAAFIVSASGPDAIAAEPVGPPMGPDVENYSPPFSGAKATKA